LARFPSTAPTSEKGFFPCAGGAALWHVVLISETKFATTGIATASQGALAAVFSLAVRSTLCPGERCKSGGQRDQIKKILRAMKSGVSRVQSAPQISDTR
jgi:hypothetical protein